MREEYADRDPCPLDWKWKDGGDSVNFLVLLWELFVGIGGSTEMGF
jgi:hypothetical protein